MKKKKLMNVSIVGRPNVGKSSLFNAIVKKRQAIVDPTPGVTRDRISSEIKYDNHHFQIIDTGGITNEDIDEFTELIKIETMKAIEESDLLIFMIEYPELLKEDYEIADMIRKSGKNTILVVNKMDRARDDDDFIYAWELSLGEPIPVSVIHKRNLLSIYEKIIEFIDITPAIAPEQEENTDKQDKDTSSNIKIAIVGKPNVGKSSLLNILLGKQRALVSDHPGTTRDSISEIVKYNDINLEFIDTAGIRRKNKVTEDLEFYSVRRSIESIKDADVVLHLIDSIENISQHDKKIASVAANRNKCMIMLVNKWDLVEEQDEDAFKEYEEWIRFRFSIIDHVPIIPISCVTSKGIKNIRKRILEAYESYSKKIETSKINSFVEMAANKYIPSNRKGLLKIKYVTQIGTKPPAFLFFVNRPQLFTENYKRYLINEMREYFDITSSPILIKVRSKKHE